MSDAKKFKELIVTKFQALIWVPKGVVAPGVVTPKQWLEYNAPAQSARSLKLSVKTEDGIVGTLDMTPKLTGASTLRIGTQPSEWDCVCSDIMSAGIGWKITGIHGLFENGKFRSTDGTELESGWKSWKLIDQEGMEFDLSCGTEDKHSYMDKFKFMKGLKRTDNPVFIGLNSMCAIYARTKDVEKGFVSNRRTRNEGASI